MLSPIWLVFVQTTQANPLSSNQNTHTHTQTHDATNYSNLFLDREGHFDWGAWYFRLHRLLGCREQRTSESSTDCKTVKHTPVKIRVGHRASESRHWSYLRLQWWLLWTGLSSCWFPPAEPGWSSLSACPLCSAKGETDFQSFASSIGNLLDFVTAWNKKLAHAFFFRNFQWHNKGENINILCISFIQFMTEAIRRTLQWNIKIQDSLTAASFLCIALYIFPSLIFVIFLQEKFIY